MRQSMVLGNWKMYGSIETVTQLSQGLREGLSGDEQHVVVGVFPPFVYLPLVAEILADSRVLLGAQDVSADEAGAHTGDIAAEMLRDVGCDFVLVGHSERRADHGESNEQVAAKYLRVLQVNLTPVLCVGETLEQREAGQTLQVVEEQCQAVLQQVDAAQRRQMIIAYEPVWAIGTGKTATPQQAQEVHGFIRGLVESDESRILYGGSVKAGNAAELFSQPDIDGGLVGGASLDAESFLQIIAAAQR